MANGLLLKQRLKKQDLKSRTRRSDHVEMGIKYKDSYHSLVLVALTSH